MRPTWAALSYLQDVMYGILGSIRGDFWGHLYNVAQINPCGRAGKSGNRRQASALWACWGHTWGPCSWDHPTLEAFWDLPSSPPHPPCLGRAQQPCLHGAWGVASLHLGPVQPAGGRGVVRMHARAAVSDNSAWGAQRGVQPVLSSLGAPTGLHPGCIPILADRPRRSPHCAEHV